MTARIVVFGREPVPGRVKTRLARELGAETAARVYRVLLEHTLAEARRSRLPVALALAAPPSPSWRPPGGVTTTRQSRGGLGARMAAAFAAAFASGADAVVLVGSDAPGLSAADLREAARLTDSAPVVLGPAEDGGYWLVAQRAPGVDLFSGIPFSSPATLAATRARLAAAGIALAELALRRDVDTRADLVAALAEGNLDPSLTRRLRRALGGSKAARG